MLEFRQIFFEDIVTSQLGYKPSIEIKPAHLANGFFRAVCGGYVNNEAQHQALYPQGYPTLGPDPTKQRDKFTQFAPTQQQALLFLKENEVQREILQGLLSADKAVFKGVSTSSYSLSHASHVTSDNHDRDAGMWLHKILSHGQNAPALDLLRELLQQEPRRRNDELSVLTLPLDDLSQTRKQKSYDNWSPVSLQIENGQFRDPLLRDIRAAFDQLAQNDAGSARQNGKLDTLRRMTTLACFSVYLHLANCGNDKPDRVPIVLRLEKNGRTLHQASIASYQWVRRSLDAFMYREIHNVVQQTFDPTNLKDEQIKELIYHQINWYRTQSEANTAAGQNKVKDYQDNCWRFYQSYRGGAADHTPQEALARAFTDILRQVLSSSPQDIARALGTRIGLLTGRNKKSYQAHPDLLEVLLRATIPKGETWPVHQVGELWASRYGILFGILGDENDRLSSWGIPPVNGTEFSVNVAALAELLEQSGYARRYADGIVLVTVGD
ncbi:MAG: hypothetical protein IAE79_27195 [Anaerolinea sp.]|nr:hypothetical protein [Anaerolinea sp.]